MRGASVFYSLTPRICICMRSIFASFSSGAIISKRQLSCIQYNFDFLIDKESTGEYDFFRF